MDGLKKDIVFVDSCIFIREHYFKRNNRLNTLVQLHEVGLVDFISTYITINEIQKHFINEIKSIYSSLIRESNELQKKGVELSLNINPEFDICKHCSDILNRFLSKTATFVIPYGELTNIEPIFAKYFKLEAPFSTGKKEEFPDAFTLGLLEAYCQKYKLGKIIILSEDSDMKNYNSPYLEYKEYKQYITEKSAEKSTLDNIIQILKDDENDYIESIKEDLSELLMDEAIYVHLIQSTDINDIDIKYIDVNVKINDYSIVSQTADYYTLEVPVDISFEVEIEYMDYTYATYDKEDHIWYNEEIEHYKASNHKTIAMLLSYHKEKDEQQPYMIVEDYDVKDALDGME